MGKLFDAFGQATGQTYQGVQNNAQTKMGKAVIDAPTPLNVRGLLDAATNIPVAGDVLSGALAAYDYSKGDKVSAAMNAMALLPFIPSITVYQPNKINPKHLNDIVEQMKTLGSPKIRAVWDGEAYQALEGSHRLAAAKLLGMEPIIEEVPLKSWFKNHDIYDLPEKTSVARAFDFLVGNRESAVSFPDMTR